MIDYDFNGIVSIRNLHFDTNFVTVRFLDQLLEVYVKTVPGSAAILDFSKTLKGERSTPTWICMSGPHRHII